MTLIRVGLGCFFGDKRSFHTSVKVWKGSKLKRSTIPSISFFLSPSSCKIYCERMFFTYVRHPCHSDRAGVGKGSISTGGGKTYSLLVCVLKKVWIWLLMSWIFFKKGSYLPVFTRSHLQPFCVGGVASQLSHYYRRWRPDRSERLAIFTPYIGAPSRQGHF